jgi:hypothetical protein
LSPKGIRGGNAWEKDRQKTKSEEGSQAVPRRCRQAGDEKARQARDEKSREAGNKDRRKESWQEIVEEIREENKAGRGQFDGETNRPSRNTRRPPAQDR